MSRFNKVSELGQNMRASAQIKSIIMSKLIPLRTVQFRFQPTQPTWKINFQQQ